MSNFPKNKDAVHLIIKCEKNTFVMDIIWGGGLSQLS